MREKGHVLLLVLLIIVLFVVVAGVVVYFQLSSQTIPLVSKEKTANWKIYSNGWYNYTFKYPKDKEIRYDGRIGGLGLMDTTISIRGERTLDCIVLVNYGSNPTVRTQGEKTQEMIKDGQKWEEYYNIHKKGDPLYERQASVRLTQKDGLNYVFASMGSEKGKFSSLCEDIFSTFKFGIDENIQSAKEAKQAKEAAIVYAKEKLPGYNFAGGVFRFLPPLPQEPLSPKGEELLKYSDKALVDFVKNDHIKPLELNKNGGWKVTYVYAGDTTVTILFENSAPIF